MSEFVLPPEPEPFFVRVSVAPALLRTVQKDLYKRADRVVRLDYDPFDKVWKINLTCSRYSIIATLVRLHRNKTIVEFTVV